MSNTSLPKGWKECRIEEIATIYVGRDLKKTSYSKYKTDSHIYPVYSNSVDNFGLYGYYDFEEYPGNCLTVVGRGSLGTAFPRTQGFAAIGRLLVVVPRNNSFNPRYLSEFINTKLKIFNESSSIPQLPGASFAKYKVILPTYREQVFIADTLEVWYAAIKKTEALIAVKKKRFDWLVARLINKSGHKNKQLSDFILDVSKRNWANTIDRVLSITNHSGFVLQKDRFRRRIASTNVSNYKIVEHGQYAYNPSCINLGAIARLDHCDEGILSPMYTIFKLEENVINSDYFLHWLSSSDAKQRIKKSTQGSVREIVSFGDFGVIPIVLPDLEIQEKISDILNTAKQEINLLKKLAERYRTQKRGLMQKLLSCGGWHIKHKEAA